MSTKDNIETVELDPDAVDTIAGAVVEKIRQFTNQGDYPRAQKHMPAAYPTPHRTILDDVPANGIVAKSGETAAKYYGGLEAKYMEAGRSDAEIATNLYIAKTILETKNPKTGQPYRNDWTGDPLVSDRLVEVMVGAATKALQAEPQRIPETIETDLGIKALDVDGFVAKGYHALRASAKAMTSTGAATGDEWVPTFATSELWRDVHLQTEVSASIPRVNMPTNPYTLPTEISDVTFRYAPTENVAVTGSDVGTGAATLTARKVAADISFSGELTEDSIVPVVPSLRANLVRRGAQTIDDLIVHGDTETGGTGNVNSDDTAPAASSFYLALSGLRKFAVVTNTGQTSNVAGALTAANVNTIRGLLGKYGARASDLRIVGGWSTIQTLLTLAEVQTLEKYGPSATILRGELGRIWNIAILQSEAIPGASIDKVDADGKYTTTSPSTNDTKGWLVIFNINGWKQGFRREFQIESDRNIQTDTNILVASFRMALIPSGISILHTASGRNVTV